MNKQWWTDENELDAKQQGIFDLPLDESHLLLGPPGSGKTNLLLLRASQLVLSGKQNILIIVFTRTLREFISTGGTEYAFGINNVKTLDGWRYEFLREQGVSPLTADAFEERRKKQLVQVRDIIKKRKLAALYDAIVLDEAQDYLNEEIDVFKQLGRVVFAAADSRQQIYANEDDVSSNLKAKFKDGIYTLKHHYRNGIRICEVADELAKVWGGYDLLVPTSNYNESEYPSTVRIQSCSDLTAQVSESIKSLNLQMKAYPNEQLGVLCPTRDTLKAVAHLLSTSSIGRFCVVQSAEDGYVKFEDEKPICVCTIHGAKGLEFRALHILESEGISKSSLNRHIAYTAVTRAKTSLTIYHAKPLPRYLDSALNVIRPAVPTAKLNQLFAKR